LNDIVKAQRPVEVTVPPSGTLADWWCEVRKHGEEGSEHTRLQEAKLYLPHGEFEYRWVCSTGDEDTVPTCTHWVMIQSGVGAGAGLSTYRTGTATTAPPGQSPDVTRQRLMTAERARYIGKAQGGELTTFATTISKLYLKFDSENELWTEEFTVREDFGGGSNPYHFLLVPIFNLFLTESAQPAVTLLKQRIRLSWAALHGSVS